LLATGLTVTLPIAANAAVPGKVLATQTRTAKPGQTVTAVAKGGDTGTHVFYLQQIGDVHSGRVLVSCTNGHEVETHTFTYNKAGIFTVPTKPTGHQSCRLTGTTTGVGGDITVTLRVS
jgi:hypothetical protein